MYFPTSFVSFLNGIHKIDDGEWLGIGVLVMQMELCKSTWDIFRSLKSTSCCGQHSSSDYVNTRQVYLVGISSKIFSFTVWQYVQTFVEGFSTYKALSS